MAVILLHPLGATLVAGLLFLLPGLALLLWLIPDLEEDWFGWLALSAGLSLSTFPLLLLWARAIGNLHIGPLVLWAILGVSILLIAWRLRSRPPILLALQRTPRGLSLLLILLAGSVIGLRLWTIRGLNIPLWGDSYQHTMMAQLIVDNGGLFDSWLPYAPLKTFTYHYGFHTTVAFFHWLTGMEMPRAVLVVGQLLNSLAAFTIYPLAVRLTGNRWVGLIAVLTAAVLSPMPGFYVNWGRYTQLAGQVILPVALWFTWEMVDYPYLDWRRLTLAALAVAGLALTHYRVILFYVAILPGWWLVYCLFDRERRSGWLGGLGRLALLATLAFLAISPWIAHTVSSRLAQQQITVAVQGHKSNFIRNEYNKFPDVRNFVPLPMLGATGVGFLLSLIHRRRTGLFIALWISSLLLLANPYLLHVPGTGIANNFSVFISLYLPASIMVGFGVVAVVRHGQRYWKGAPWIMAVMLVAASLWAARAHARMVAPSFVMVTPEDERAMEWIRANTPPDAKFLVNGFFAYGGSSVVGADAGWWIPLLAGRENTTPPLTYVSETPIAPDYPRQVRDLVAQIQATDLSAPDGLGLLKQQGISHIYIGQNEGRVGNPGTSLLSARVLLAAPYYQPIYHEDKAWVFKIRDDLVGEKQ